MKHKWIQTAVIGAAGLTAALMIGAARAIGPVPVVEDAAAEAEGPGEPETVCFYIVEQAHIGPVKEPTLAAAPRRTIVREWTDEDAQILARLLWSSPLRNEDYKRQLCWLIFNRCDDEGPLFGLTIRENVNRNEFTFYDRKAYVSDTNLRIAREELERWTRVLAGLEERPVPEGYVYLRFLGDNNRLLELTKTIGGEAL